MILLLDIGNSRTKWAVLADSGLGLSGERAHAGGAELLPADIPVNPSQVYAANVAGPQVTESLASAVRSRWSCPLVLARTPAVLGPVRNAYTEPAQLGVDRWLALVAAYERHAGALCVVDAGTATTVDLIAADGQHLGGFIVPGLDLMSDSLLTATGDLARLRERAVADSRPAPACSTGLAIRDGARLATAGLVDRARGFLPRQAQLLLTGGRGESLAGLTGGEFLPRLVLEGLAVTWRAGAAEN
ncbi:MAG: type III pantothenate kinase [Gammaproteobacteria bacterium]